MRASYVAALAFLLLVIGRWAHNKPAFDVRTVAGGVFVILVIAALDQGSTEEIARGLAWILLAVVVLSTNSPLSGIAALVNRKATGKALTPAQQKTGRGGPGNA